MNLAIILSGGVGSRMGLSIPKQYAIVNGQFVLGYCLDTFLHNANTDALIIVVADEWKKDVVNLISKKESNKPIFYAKPGETRQYSILNALNTAKDNGASDNDIVIIHDAARPLVDDELINRCYSGCHNAEGVMPVIPVKDTVYYSDDGIKINSLLSRNKLWAGQAPEAFVFGKYYQIHKEMQREELLKINGSTEIAFKSGMNIKMIEGSPMNFKITTIEDLSNFKSIINNK